MSAPDLAGRLVRLQAVLLLCTFAAGGVALAQAFASPALLGLTLAAGLAFPVARRRRLRAGPGLEALAIVTGVLLAAGMWRASGEAAPGLAVFLLLAQALKVLAPAGERDEALGCLVGLVLAGVASAEAVSPAFGLLLGACLLLTLALGTCRTLLLQVRRAGGRAVSGALLGRRGARGYGGALVLLVLGTLATFFVVPRFGVKLLHGGRGSAAPLSGFTDEVGLDSIGRIKQSQEVAFRAELEGAPGEGPYWRGAALDRYDGRGWRVSDAMRGNPTHMAHVERTVFLDPALVGVPDDAFREATIYLEPLGTRYLISLGTTQRLGFKGARPLHVSRDVLGGYRARGVPPISLAYRVRFIDTPAPQHSIHPVLEQRVRKACLALPPRVDVERLRAYAVEALARRGVDPAAAPSEVAHALEQHLRRTYRYTLDVTAATDAEPVEDFLFHKRAGHCELFASSLALLLRALGVPARLVTGFRGGEHDRWDETFTVRQRDAHAWLEVLTEAGWERFDPTPAEPQRQGAAGLAGALASASDWLELRWYKYVIAWDAYDQRSAIDAVRRALAAGWEAAGQAPAAAALGAGAAGTLLLALLALIRGARRRGWARGRAREVPLPGSAELARVVAALAAVGVRRRPDETPLELARRARRELGPPAQPLVDWIPDYYTARFGGRPAAPDPAPLLAALAARRDGGRACA